MLCSCSYLRRLSVTMADGFVTSRMRLRHGSGYVVVTLTRTLGIGFVPALAISAVVVGAVSVVFERFLYRRLYKSNDLEQCCSLSASLHGDCYRTYFYGPIPKSCHCRMAARRHQSRLPLIPSYRAFLICWESSDRCALYGFRAHNIGAKIRPRRQPRMAESVALMSICCLRSPSRSVRDLPLWAAGSPFNCSSRPILRCSNLVLFLIVVAVGGLGSLKGTLLARWCSAFRHGGKYLLAMPAVFHLRRHGCGAVDKACGFYGASERTIPTASNARARANICCADRFRRPKRCPG